MPDPATAEEGVFADGFEPLGDGRAPWSRWAEPDIRKTAIREGGMSATETVAGPG